jgi:glucose-1-phosphate thymidylyltransferase
LNPGKVDAWMDCGNKDATVDTNKQTLGYEKGGKHLIAKTASIENSIIIEPCFIGENVVIKNSKIGPFVSIGIGTVIENSNIENSLIQNNATLRRANIENSMVGNQARYSGTSSSISIGDYSVLE